MPVANLATLAQSKSVAAQQGFGLVFVMFNTGSAPMDDVRNRQAQGRRQEGGRDGGGRGGRDGGGDFGGGGASGDW